MTDFNQCPNCDNTPGSGVFDGCWFTIYECDKCGSFYCYDCGGERCPDCGSKERSEAGEVHR